LPISLSELDAITPIQIFNLFLTNSIIGQLVANTNSYAQQQLFGPEKEWQRSWQPVTTQKLYLWLAIQIHIGLIGVPPERYWMKDGVYLPKDGLPPAAYLGKTRFTGKNDLTRRVSHREAVFGPVIHSIFDVWHYDVLWTCELTRLL